MAPAVFVPKKSEEIRVCIDYHELNKKTTKDAYLYPYQTKYKIVWQVLVCWISTVWLLADTSKSR